MKIDKKCQECSVNFQAELKEINRGNAKFCSRKCSLKKGLRIKVKKQKEAQIKITCSLCEKEIFRSSSKLKNSKHQIYFCSRKCKDNGQKISQGITQIHPPHYNLGQSKYRKKALTFYGSVCQNKECALKSNFIPEKMLDVHHKVLCVWCHALSTRKNWD